MFNLHLTAEQIEFRDTVQSFVANEIQPAAIHPNRLEPFEKPLMKDWLDKTSELGLRTLMLSEESGGVGADMMTSCIVLEELAKGDVDIAIILAQTALLSSLLFDNWMTKEHTGRFLPRFIKDRNFHLAYAGLSSAELTGWCYHGDLHEDPSCTPTAVKQGRDWFIDGSVSYVANAPIAELFVVPVRTDSGTLDSDGSGPLLVPRGAPGLTIDGPIKAVGKPNILWQHGCGAKVEFNSCKVPNDNRLSSKGKGLVNGGDYAKHSVLQRAAVNLGLGRAAFAAAVEYSKIRRQGGRNIVEHQGIGKMIAEMALKLELASTMIWKAAWVTDHPEAVTDRSVSNLPLHTIASVFTAEAVHEVTLIAAECFGAMGVMRDMPVQKYVDDGFKFLHSDTNDIATILPIAEAVVNFQRSWPG